MILNWSLRFRRAYKKVPHHIRDDFKVRARIFVKNPWNPRLKTHRLHGRLKEFYSFYLRDDYRVFFDFVKETEVDLLYVGPHDSYKRL